MARAGIAALQFWDPASRKWGQAHVQARTSPPPEKMYGNDLNIDMPLATTGFAILQVFLSAPDNFCALSHSKEDVSDLKIHLDRSKIASHGRPAINAFLQKLHIFKATADVKAGKKLYEDYTSVNEWYATKVRPEVLRQAKPRKVFVQANTFLKEGGKVELREYEPSPEGMIQSFVDRDYI